MSRDTALPCENCYSSSAKIRVCDRSHALGGAKMDVKKHGISDQPQGEVEQAVDRLLRAEDDATAEEHLEGVIASVFGGGGAKPKK